MRYILLLLLFLAGCITPINSLDGKKFSEDHVKTVDSLREYYFTPEAREFIDEIPCVTGFTVHGSYVVGVNFWSTMAGILTGSGYERKCVMDEESLERFGPEAIIHEYLHHLDDIGRDGERQFIDIEEFRKAYVRMATDHLWAGLVLYAERRANKFFTNVFGIGELSEHIAYVGGRMAVQQSGPDYMWKVFEGVIRKHGQENATCCDGMDTEH